MGFRLQNFRFSVLFTIVLIMTFSGISIGKPTREERLRQGFMEHRLSLLENGFNVFAKEDSQRQGYTEHRLELLEDGFNVFANEVLPHMEKMQKKMEFVSETNKRLYKMVEDVTEENENIVEELVRQESVISDLLWAASDLKGKGLSTKDRKTLSELEWTVFDLKHSTLNLIKDVCLRETVCSDWSDWSACSVTCGTGSTSRLRECTNDGKFKAYCDPGLYERSVCNEARCGVRVLPRIPELECPEYYSSYYGYCFRFSEDRAARIVSSFMCETDDAHLVEIDSPEKQYIVSGFVREVGSSYMKETDTEIKYTNSNIGGDRHTGEALETQVSIDGIRHRQETDYLNWKEKKMTFFRWAKGQPRNDKSDGDYCLTMDPEGGYWYLRCCSKQFYYICEAPPGGIY